MSKDPAVLFYTSDFISGTLLMSDEQRGKYIILLCLQHQQGGLTEDDMMNICKTYDKKIFSKFELLDDGLYYNERMKTESERRKAYSKSRRDNRKSSKTSKTYDEHMETGTETITTTKSEIVIKEVPKIDFIGQIIEQFQSAYKEIRGVDYEVTNDGKERSSAGKLLGIYKKNVKDADGDKTLKDLRKYFGQCLLISDEWLYNNMSLPIILSKFNEINTNIRNGNKGKKGGATRQELTEVVFKHFGEKG